MMHNAALFSVLTSCCCPDPASPARTKFLQMGFFAEAGPLQVFVSNHLIPETFEFNTAHEPCYQVRCQAGCQSHVGFGRQWQGIEWQGIEIYLAAALSCSAAKRS